MDVKDTHTLTFVILIHIFVSICLMAGLEFKDVADDVWFPKIAATYDSVFAWLKHRYVSWSGRVVADLLLPVFLSKDVWIWRLVNASFFLLFIAASYRFCSVYLTERFTGIKAWQYWLFFMITIFLVNRYVLDEGIFWATGSINYLWPAACLILALVPFARIISGPREIKSTEFLLSIIAVLFASYQEQTGLILVCFSIIAQLWAYCREKAVVKSCVFLSLFAAVNVSFLLFAPGNTVRYYKEIENYYPGFETLSIGEKLYDGLNYLVLNHWFYDSYKPFLVVLLITLWISWKKAPRSRVKYVALAPLGYLLICVAVSRIIGGDYGYLLNLDIYEHQTNITSVPQNIPYSLNLWPIVIGTCSLVILPVSWLTCLSIERSLTLTVLYAAALFSAVIVSLSPTIYASSYRIFFIPNVVMLVTGLLLFGFMLELTERRNIPLTITYIIFALMGVSSLYEYCALSFH